MEILFAVVGALTVAGLILVLVHKWLNAFGVWVNETPQRFWSALLVLQAGLVFLSYGLYRTGAPVPFVLLALFALPILWVVMYAVIASWFNKEPTAPPPPPPPEPPKEKTTEEKIDELLKKNRGP